MSGEERQTVQNNTFTNPDLSRIFLDPHNKTEESKKKGKKYSSAELNVNKLYWDPNSSDLHIYSVNPLTSSALSEKL